MGIRISGLVRAAREAQHRVQRGIEAEERARFLAWVGDQVAATQSICDEHGAAPQDLPAPSRRAFAVLEKILVGGPEAIPAPGDGGPAVRHLRVRGLVGMLQGALTLLDGAAEDDAAVQRAVSVARGAVEEVQEICGRNGAEPAALAGRSGPAFGLLDWLSDPEHAAWYARSHALGMEVLQHAAEADRTGSVVRLTFEPSKQIYAVRRRGRLVRAQLSIGFLAAGRREYEDLAAVAFQGAHASAQVRRRLAAFLDSEAFHDLREACRIAWEGTCAAPRGRAYDLDVLFDRLNARYFEGRMARPRLAWRPSLSRRRFGSYAPGPDVVVIDTRLDDPLVPEYVAECVLYHELLHKRHGAYHDGNRRRSHTPAFRADERLHPRFEDSERWLKALARGESLPK